ncbi:hypothetical protein PHABIO_458 [Pseudomonas phage Phabio]|uniref:Uncharacterized protein n=1 Tax=Pseudomonas phage Phabio TaxID=2006668 RepID=A0A1Y0SZI2_9CAUD|nr:hypothetical protein MZD05_gp461 [Pseudomonas phage Phabio]ARV77086.1 hypothetical protein PHABIO_458 [Pseudomonas phage Phabio]
MSLKALIELANNPLRSLTPEEITERQLAFQERMQTWDRQVEARMKARQLTSEQLNKLITI